MQSPARRFYIGGAFVEDTDVAFRFAVQGNRKVDLEIASVVGQFVVVQSDTGDGLVAAQVIITFGALLKRNPHRRNTREINVNEGQCERNMPGIIAAAFISGNIDTDFAFHHGLPGESADVPKSEHGRPVRDYRNEIPLACVVVRLVGVGLYLKARKRNKPPFAASAYIQHSRRTHIYQLNFFAPFYTKIPPMEAERLLHYNLAQSYNPAS